MTDDLPEAGPAGPGGARREHDGARAVDAGRHRGARGGGGAELLRHARRLDAGARRADGGAGPGGDGGGAGLDPGRHRLRDGPGAALRAGPAGDHGRPGGRAVPRAGRRAPSPAGRRGRLLRPRRPLLPRGVGGDERRHRQGRRGPVRRGLLPPRRDGGGIHPATVYAMHAAGADAIMCLGGVQAVAAMAYGLFTGRRADVLAGPGNRFVAEAKRLLFGQVGIDVFAGRPRPSSSPTRPPTRGPSPWTSSARPSTARTRRPCSSRPRASWARRSRDGTAGAEPLPTCEVAMTAWTNCGEVVVVDSREEAAVVADEYASEHVEVHAADLPWWHDTLRNYGTLFLGEETTVSYGDKSAGPNHILPTRGASRYYRRAVGGQVPQDADVPADDTGGQSRRRRGSRPDLPGRGHGGPCPLRRRAPREVLSGPPYRPFPQQAADA